jgi:hypothetical protein
MRCIGRRVEMLVGHGCSAILNPYLFLCFRFRGGVAAGKDIEKRSGGGGERGSARPHRNLTRRGLRL